MPALYSACPEEPWDLSGKQYQANTLEEVRVVQYIRPMQKHSSL